MSDTENDHPYANTPAALMLNEGLRKLSLEEGVSLREVGRRLGYKHSVVVSHMSTGRVPIPLDRAKAIAHILKISDSEFISAVLRQRHPDINWDELFPAGRPPEGSPAEFIWSLEAASGVPVNKLDPDQIRVMREVAAAPDAGRRWLTVHEAGLIEMVRRVRPEVSSRGLDRTEFEKIEKVLGPCSE